MRTGVVLASDILVAIFENLRSQNNKRQLFMKVGYNDWQEIFYKIFGPDGQYLFPNLYFKCGYLEKLFVFSNSGSRPFSPPLQEAIEHLQFAGIICWPDHQEPDVMRLNPSGTEWYELELLRNTDYKLAYQDVVSAQEIAKSISAYRGWRKLFVDRPHLMNLP